MGRSAYLCNRETRPTTTQIGQGLNRPSPKANGRHGLFLAFSRCFPMIFRPGER
jgi:hypothetical protein